MPNEYKTVFKTSNKFGLNFSHLRMCSEKNKEFCCLINFLSFLFKVATYTFAVLITDISYVVHRKVFFFTFDASVHRKTSN